MKEVKRVIQFATKNKGKFDEAACVAIKYGIELAQVRIEKYETQDDDLRKIATVAAEQALLELKTSAIVAEDAGFFIDALNGFPGPYSSYVYKTLGVNGILKLMEKTSKREAHFASAVAYCGGGHTKCFEGIVKGKVDFRPRGKQGFGFDPIFIPNQGDGRTFAQMDIDQKNQYSHRALAFSKFCKWAKSQPLQND